MKNILFAILLVLMSLVRTNVAVAGRSDPVQPPTCVEKYQAIATIYNAAIAKNGGLLSGEIAITSPATATVTHTLVLLARVGSYTAGITCTRSDQLANEGMAAQFVGALSTAIALRLLAERQQEPRQAFIDVSMEYFNLSSTAIMGAADAQ